LWDREASLALCRREVSKAIVRASRIGPVANASTMTGTDMRVLPSSRITHSIAAGAKCRGEIFAPTFAPDAAFCGVPRVREKRCYTMVSLASLQTAADNCNERDTPRRTSVRVGT
jgi:hypothetical protein